MKRKKSLRQGNALRERERERERERRREEDREVARGVGRERGNLKRRENQFSDLGRRIFIVTFGGIIFAGSVQSNSTPASTVTNEVEAQQLSCLKIML